MTLRLIAATAFGLEALVRRELETLGYSATVVSPGWIRFEAGLEAICRSNLWLRTADRVGIQLAEFPCQDFDQLFDTTKGIDWSAWIPADGAVHVIGRSIKSQLSSVPACQRTVKKAIVDSLLAAHGVDTLPESGTTYKVEIAILKDVATLTLDTTGASLHKRGYRARAAAAPLKETLAAAMVQLSFWNAERPFIDPFCGSGTLAIEAAMIGRNMAPGLKRNFAAEDWPVIDAKLWRQAREEANEAIAEPFHERLVATDEDPRVLQVARNNAELAGVADHLHFQQRSFHELTSKRQHGCLITNPPYGQRIGERGELTDLYRSFPVVLRNLPSWSHFILTGYPNFERVIQKSADRRRKLYNGRIECTFFQFHGPKPGTKLDTPASEHKHDAPGSESNQYKHDAQASESTAHPNTQTPTVAQPVFGGLNPKADEQAELFQRRLTKRARHLRRWPTKQGITCYRLYDRDIPEIPLVVDRYEDHLHICEYERPHDRDLAQHADWLDLMKQAAASALEVPLDQTFLKQRIRQRGNLQHEAVDTEQYEITVTEAGHKFIINLSDYIDTGLFLDHRKTRAMVAESAAGTNFLNLFGYTGAFTVYAAAAGAARTTTVDWSRTYQDWTGRNFDLNGIRSTNNRLIRANAAQYVHQLPKEPTFDLVVLDPPTFSNSKRTEQDWDVQRDHRTLIHDILVRMKKGGLLFFSTNFRRFKPEFEELPASDFHEISRQTVPDDFRNQRIHRCWRIVR